MPRTDTLTRILEAAGQPLSVRLDRAPRRDALRVVRRPFAGAELPVLSCQDLAIFKAFFDRTKNRADLEAMAAAGVLDVAAVTGVLVEYLGPDDPRIERVVEVARAGAASDADS